jgi:hypothetical protein
MRMRTTSIGLKMALPTIPVVAPAAILAGMLSAPPKVPLPTNRVGTFPRYFAVIKHILMTADTVHVHQSDTRE